MCCLFGGEEGKHTNNIPRKSQENDRTVLGQSRGNLMCVFLFIVRKFKRMGMAKFKRTFARTSRNSLRPPRMKMLGFETKRARKFTRTLPRTLPWDFIARPSAPPILVFFFWPQYPKDPAVLKGYAVVNLLCVINLLPHSDFWKSKFLYRYRPEGIFRIFFGLILDPPRYICFYSEKGKFICTGLFFPPVLKGYAVVNLLCVINFRVHA